MKLFVAFLLVSACTAKTYDDRIRSRGNLQSTYDVWDFEIVSAQKVTGRIYRIAVVNDRHFNDERVDVEGTDGLSDSERSAIPLGQTKKLTFPFLKLRSIHGALEEFQPIDFKSGIVANVTHVRSCNVSVEEHEKTEIVGDSSKGIITVPKLKTSVVRTFTAPPCEDPSDHVVEQKRTGQPSVEILAEKKKADAAAAERELNIRISKRAEELDREFSKKAAAAKFAEIPPFCPRVAGLMSAAGISEIKFARVETKHEEHQGYTEVVYANRLTFLPANVTLEDSDYREAAQDLKSLKLSSVSCLTVDANQTPSEDVAKAVEHAIRKFVRDANYERATKELGH